ncbi:MAG: TraR/DksA C4-type zinc finger protein [Candidatus Paceibacterota bacterium]|jgi:RNA polymerase-binding transcription factor DksA
MKIDTKHFNELLLKEQTLLEKELETVARKNPKNPNDWQPMSTDMEKGNIDENETADVLEDFEENISITGKLEVQLNDVKDALDRIAKGTYGVCDVCQKEIDTKRLEAIPSAHTCTIHSH